MGKAKVEIAKLKRRENEIENAFLYLNAAERLFLGAKESEALEEVHKMRQEFENTLKEMIETSIKDYSLVLKWKDLSSLDAEDLLSELWGKTNADRAFVAFREKDKFHLEAFKNIQEKAANTIIKALIEKNGDIKSGNLLIHTQRLHRDSLRYSLIMPFGKGVIPAGFLYADRGDNKGPFKNSEVTLFAIYADNFLLKLKSMEKEKLMSENIELRRLLMERAEFSGIVTQNHKMLEILEQVQLLSEKDIPVLIEGETGTGKELLALALHYEGPRKDKKFITVNCAAIPRELFESELFGHEKGSFTGAMRRKLGKFELADGGTIFLDEIGDMDLSSQAKLLRVLDRGEFQRVGGIENIKVDVRVIAATNKDLEGKIREGRFREDLYHRLKGARIKLPPLRERKDDIPLLVDHFLKKYSADRKQPKRITAGVLEMLISYDWPGNVRELENEIRRAIVLSGGNKEIAPEVFSKVIEGGSEKGERKGESEDFSLFFQEREKILKALIKNKWVKRRAARYLGVPESTLRVMPNKTAT